MCIFEVPSKTDVHKLKICTNTRKPQNFALVFASREAKNAASIYPTFDVPILIRNDSLTSDEIKAKAVRKHLISRMSYEHFG